MMKKLIIIISLLSLFCCDKNDYDYDIKYFEIDNLFNCLSCFSITNIHVYSGFIINDNETYKKYIDSLRIYPLNITCDTSTTINIDFNKYTLIGILTEYNDCDSISKEIICNNNTKKINYIIKISKNNELHKILKLSLNLMLISKVPNNYNIEFNINSHSQRF